MANNQSNDMTPDELEMYLREVQALKSQFALAIIMYPEMVDMLGGMLKMSASMMITNSYGLKAEMEALVQESNEFLDRMKAGELDPFDFLTEEDHIQKAKAYLAEQGKV